MPWIARSSRLPGMAVLAWIALASGGTRARAVSPWLDLGDLSQPGLQQLPIRAEAAMNAAGHVLVTSNRFDGNNWIVEATERPPGGRFSAPVTLSPGGRDAYAGGVAMNDAGDATIAWVRNDGANWIVQATVRSAGQAFSAPVDLSAVGRDAHGPQVAMNEAGDAIVVWSRYTGSYRTPQAAWRSAGGDFWVPITLLPDGDCCGDNHSPQVAIDAGGHAIVVWLSSLSPSDQKVRGVHLAVSPLEFYATFDEPYASYGFDLVMNTAGEAIFVWMSNHPGSQSGISAFSASVRGKDPVYRGPIDLAWSYPPENHTDPMVALNARGDAVVVWNRWKPLNDNGTPNIVIRATTRSAGGDFGMPVDLSSPERDARSPQVGIDAAGNAIVVWIDNTKHSVVQAVTRRAGGIFTGLTDLSAADGAENAHVAMNETGNAVVLWSSYDANSGNSTLHGASYDPSGPQLRDLSVPASGTVGVPVSFSVAPVDWSGVASTTFAFGDGVSVAGTSVRHAYGSPGTYQVAVTSTDVLGNTTARTRDISIAPSTSPPGGSTSTTTLAPIAATTTTTTIAMPIGPAPCDVVAGLARARCLIDAALSGALCSDPMPRQLERSLRRQLAGASKKLDLAATAGGRRQVRLVTKVRKVLRGAGRLASKPAASRRARAASDACVNRVRDVVAAAEDALGR